MKYRPSSGANSSSERHEFPHLLRNPKVNFRVNNSLPIDPILSQLNPVHDSRPFSFNIHFSIISLFINLRSKILLDKSIVPQPLRENGYVRPLK